MQIAIRDAVDFEMPDVVMASREYATRFRGKLGRWFLKVQEQAVIQMIKEWPHATVLDVGGGHGQLTKGLIDAGYRVTVLGSHEICRERIQPFVEAGTCRFEIGNVFDLPFEDRSFDLAVSFRMMPHAKDWQRFLTELARVARKAVVIDYAVLKSMNVLAEKLFWLKKTIEKNTTGYALYAEEDIIWQFSKVGFRQKERIAQYFFPMALHRFFQNLSLSKTLEFFPRLLGLTHLLGSPVIACFTPLEIRKGRQ